VATIDGHESLSVQVVPGKVRASWEGAWQSLRGEQVK
jgi:hypothetical protein